MKGRVYEVVLGIFEQKSVKVNTIHIVVWHSNKLDGLYYPIYTANVYRQTTDEVMFKTVIFTQK